MTQKIPAPGAQIDDHSFIGAGRFEPPSYAFSPVTTRALRSFTDVGPLSKVTTLIAPPGYGKTVLMTQLYKLALDRGAVCFWIGIDDRASDLPMLLAAMEHAIGLDQIGDVTPIIRDPRGNIPDRIDRLVALLNRQAGETVFFLDNLNGCTDPALALLLDALVFRTSPSFRLIMSSTIPIPFDIARARIEMKLRRITAAELGFDQHATAAILESAGLTALTEDTIAAVVEKTEGWPAAIRLVQLIMTGESDPEQGLESFSGADSDFAAMLSRRLMATFDADLVRFLYDIAELRGFSAELAAAATGDARAGEWIRYLVERNVLIVPLDRSRTWYRFHGLFRQFLLAEAERVQAPDRRLAVIAAAAAWLDQRGDLAYALELALTAPVISQVSSILERIAHPMVRDRGELATFVGCVERARLLGVDLGVDTLLWYTWALVFTRQYEEAVVALNLLAERIEREIPGAPRNHALWGRHRMMQIMVNFHLDRLTAVREESPGWLHDFPDANPFEYAAIAGGFGIASAVVHDFPAARDALRLSNASIIRSRSDYGRAWVATVGVTIDLLQGDPAEADRQLRDVEQRVRTNLGDGASIVSVLTLAEARVAADLGRFSDAMSLVTFGMERGVNDGILDTTWFGIDVAVESASLGTGPFTLAELYSFAHRYSRRLPLLLDLALIRQWLREGKTAEALERAEAAGIWVKPGSFQALAPMVTPMEQSAACLAGIDLLTATGNLKDAGALLDEETKRATETGRRREQVELHLMQAAIKIRSDNQDAAVRALARAITIAARRQLVRPFVQQRGLVTQLIDATPMKRFGLTLDTDVTFFNTICTMLGASPQVLKPKVDEDEAFPVDPPTPREIELLQLLDSGLDNTQIAARLSLSVPTVKWHLYNIYSKLG
ncbi:hypothetical protein D3874_22435 [Oleomonas cavernae]|uniref:HTH luxR-type domain-containing protein n=1 Tax=Oleomonas cavernae TaxID=2320859 RepID=A0A418WHB1_9PROT|nr:LuxR C-terminal-related transcriptional regulator [Oleomonas cavernae]RJF89390.1 hypothetical protein D3874_22435 [Oleomonas cavernae]